MTFSLVAVPLVALLMVAGASLCWPAGSWTRRHSRRAKGGAGSWAGRVAPGSHVLRWCAAAAAAAVIGTAIVSGGPAGALAAVVTCWTAKVLVRQQLSARRRRQGLTDILAAVRTMARELRAGAEPGAATESGRAVARGDGAAVLQGLALMMQAQEVRAGERGAVTAEGASPAAASLERLRAGWLLSSRYGVAFSPLIDGLATELAEALAADARRVGEVAGPRMSGYVMAGLPVMGLLLGAGMGADPVGVLLETPVGRVLLVAGVLLTCAGLLWSARIVAS